MSLENLLEQHKEVFEGLGALKGHKAKISVDVGAQPPRHAQSLMP